MKLHRGVTLRLLLLSSLLLAMQALADDLFYIGRLRETLLSEFLSKGAGLAHSLASSSVEVIQTGDVSTLQGFIDEYKQIEGIAYVYILDRSGHVLVHTFTPAFPDGFERLNALTSGEATEQVAEVERDGVWALDIAVPILAGAVGAAHVGMDRALVERRTRSAAWGSIQISAVVLLVALLIALLFARRLVAPIEHLTRVTRKLASGDLNQAPLQISSHGEIGELAASFNGTLALLRELSQKAAEVAAGNLSITVDAEGDLAAAFRAMITALRLLLESLSTASREVADASAEIYAASRAQEEAASHQAGGAEEASRSMLSLVEAATHISEAADAVRADAERARATAELTARRIGELTSQTSRMEEVLELIQEIANRADLIALNSALEATRAGEAGRSFSLVAAESRRLAERISASVQRVRGLIAEVRASSSSTAAATEESRKLADSTSETATRIALISKHQRRATEQVSETIASFSSVLSQSAAATRQTRASAEIMKEQAANLAELLTRFRRGK